MFSRIVPITERKQEKKETLPIMLTKGWKLRKLKKVTKQGRYSIAQKSFMYCPICYRSKANLIIEDVQMAI